MEEEEENNNGEDGLGLGFNRQQTFNNQAINRQVNYVSEKPIDVDFSQFDKLQIVH